MDEKKLYGRWFFWDEIIGFPMMIYYWIKGEKIRKMLENKINSAKEKSNLINLTEKTKNEYLIEYEKVNNFFSLHFKEIDNVGKKKNS